MLQYSKKLNNYVNTMKYYIKWKKSKKETLILWFCLYVTQWKENL